MIRKLAVGVVLTFALLTGATVTHAADIPQHDRAYYEKHTEAHVYESKTGKKMPYRLFMPRGYDPKKKYPLVLSLHGAGSRGSDNVKQLRPWVAGWLTEEVQKEHPCIILMPQCPSGRKWVDTPWGRGSYAMAKVPISEPMTLAKEIFDKIVREKSVDKDRIYVMGASMGGYGTWNFVMRYPQLVAAAVPICGAGDPSMAASIKDVPIWAFHGDKDNVVPPTGTTDMIEAIGKAGGTQAKFTMYKDVRHDSYTRAWKDPKLVAWVFDQRKTPADGTTAPGRPAKP